MLQIHQKACPTLKNIHVKIKMLICLRRVLLNRCGPKLVVHSQWITNIILAFMIIYYYHNLNSTQYNISSTVQLRSDISNFIHPNFFSSFPIAFSNFMYPFCSYFKWKYKKAVLRGYVVVEIRAIALIFSWPFYYKLYGVWMVIQ